MTSSLKSESRGDLLIVSFTESRILDEAKIRQVGDELISTLNKTDEDKLLLDFRGVSFMSSAMLGTLVRFHKKCKEFKVQLKFCNIAPEIFTVFKITRLDKVFEIHDDASAAQAAFQR